jgi:hypothetical protein
MMGGPASALWQHVYFTLEQRERYWERNDAAIRCGSNLRELEYHLRGQSTVNHMPAPNTTQIYADLRSR